jgi:hypothetical protein
MYLLNDLMCGIPVKPNEDIEMTSQVIKKRKRGPPMKQSGLKISWPLLIFFMAFKLMCFRRKSLAIFTLFPLHFVRV